MAPVLSELIPESIIEPPSRRGLVTKLITYELWRISGLSKYSTFRMSLGFNPLNFIISTAFPLILIIGVLLSTVILFNSSTTARPGIFIFKAFSNDNEVAALSTSPREGITIYLSGFCTTASATTSTSSNSTERGFNAIVPISRVSISEPATCKYTGSIFPY